MMLEQHIHFAPPWCRRRSTSRIMWQVLSAVFSTARPANPYDPNGDNETTGRDREQTKDYAPHVGAVSCLKRQ